MTVNPLARASETTTLPVDVLLVDDRPEDLVSLSAILDGPAYHLVLAHSGSEALRQLLERDFAVILVDVLMPNMDGFELASLVRQRERSRDTPIIFLTALGSDVSKIYRGYAVGGVDYLPKPVEPDVLRAKVAIFAELFRRAVRLEAQATVLQEAERRERELQISELKLAAERRYLNLAEAIPEIVWTADPQGRLDYANRRFGEYTGMTLEAARGRGWLGAVHEEDASRAEQALQEAIRGQDVYEAEFRLRRWDGAYRWHLARAVPERSDDGRIVAWLGTASDFEELKQAIAAREEFLSIASHELRTPLTALKLRIQTLLSSKNLDPALEHKLASAARQTQRLELLIDNLFDISRLATGHLVLERGSVDLAELAGEVVDRLREEAAQAGTEITLERNGPMIGDWDRLRLEQVTMNLLSNALRYGDKKPIVVSVDGDPMSAELAVRDHGLGIAPADLERIFDRFERVSSGHAPGGLGMGLYITRQIALAHGGDIAVESRVGEGSLFRLRLPRTALSGTRR